MNPLMQRMRLASATETELTAASLLVKHQTDLMYRQLQTAPETVVFTNMMMPTELLYAAGLKPLNTEMLAGWLSTLGLAPACIEEAHKTGVGINACSYHKAVIGALELGMLPPPKVSIVTSHLCNGGNMMARYYRERFGAEVFVLEVPHRAKAAERGWLIDNLQKALSFLQDYSGKQISQDRIDRVFENSNAARADFMRANEMRKRETLFHGYLALRNMFGSFFLLGSGTGVDVARAYCEDLSKRKAVTAGKRVLWIHFAPLHAREVMRFFEQELGCAIAFDITGHVYWEPLNPAEPMESLAKKMTSHFFLQGSDQRIGLYKALVSEYRMDGVILFAHKGCSAISGSAWEVRKACSQASLPFLELSGDCIDPNGLSLHQTKLRMEAFAESMEKRYVFRN